MTTVRRIAVVLFVVLGLAWGWFSWRAWQLMPDEGDWATRTRTAIFIAWMLSGFVAFPSRRS